MRRLVILLSRIQHLNSFESGSNPDFLRRQSSHQPSVSDWGLPECEGGPGELESRPSLQHPLRPRHVRTPPSWFTSHCSQGLCNTVEEKWAQILQQIKKKKGQRQKRHRKEVEDMAVFTFHSLCGIWNTPARFWVFSLDSIGIWVSEGKPSALFYRRHCTRPVSTGLFLHSWAEIKGRINVTGKNLGWRWRP